ncbi:penicillin-binding protein 2 [Frankia sp. AgB32]|uniref:peptidoglycan D,D-transpeptidase FtsI family protein n=1 Tax=Frankia sp. AgB32 TaxID=631119 RepID=UPI00200DC163|nr:penicillin-binding protein 2 [Frankia sp. AgB32]MCK9893857.1 penicillin-binding protein 2 [Frankia sp. AgB32]
MSSTLSGPPRRGRGRLRLVAPPPNSVHGGRLRRDDEGDEPGARRPAARGRYRDDRRDRRGIDRPDHGHPDDVGYDDEYDEYGADDHDENDRRGPGGSGGRPERSRRSSGASAARAGTSRSGASGTGTTRAGSARTGSTRTGTGRTGTARTGTARTGTARTGTARTGTARTGTARNSTARGGAGGRTTDSDAGVRRVHRPGTAPRAGAASGAGRRRPRPLPPRTYRLGSPRRRVRVAILLMCALLGILALRLTQLQGISASKYAAQAEAQRLRTIVLPAARGALTDRSGHTLAQHVELRAVYANPMNVKDIRATAAALAPVLNVPVDTLAQRMTTDPKRNIKFVYLARGLTPDVGDKVTHLELRGIGITEERGRAYPAGPLASNVVGFMRQGVDDVLVGGGGLELQYDSLLRGTDGERQLLANPEGLEIPSGHTRQKDPKPGSALRLTLDRDIQWNAQQAIADAVTSSQADGGTVIVMDPRTGDLLAMADAPQFNPNHITAQDTPALGNRATSDAYEPGSVNKVITMAAALDRGEITAETPITVPPSIVRGGVRISDSEPHGVENLTTAGVLARSSNIGTVEVADRVGRTALEQALRAFGLGAKTGLGFPGEGTGLLPPAKDWSGSQAATIAYGQGMSATALQMASVYATIANGGVRVTPRLVDAITGPDRKATMTPHPAGRRVVSAQTASTLTRMLEAVATNEGTAPLAEVPGYRVAGKTGTANRPDPVHGGYAGYTSSFIGFAPADSPRVVVEVVLDNPKNGYFGGQVAAPVFQKVMSFALTTLGVPQPTTKPAPLVLDLDK